MINETAAGTGNDKVSVIIPVYNRETTLRQCLQSLLEQDYSNYEVILVDSFSTDKTGDIISEFKKRSGRIRCLFEPKMGVGAARNRGEREAKGEIILMTDSDCVLPRNWIMDMIKPIVEGGHIAVQGFKRSVYENYWTEHIEDEEKKLAVLRSRDKKIGLLDTANFAIRKSVLKDVGYTNREIFNGNDTELMVRLKMQGYDIHHTPVSVLHHHPNTAKELFRRLFVRAVWDWKIRRSYRRRKVLFTDVSPLSHLRFLAGLGLELITMHDNFRYDLISGIAWRIGSIYGILSKWRASY